MRPSTKCVDSDGHVIENNAEIYEFLDPPYRNAPSLIAAIKRSHSLWPDLDGFSRPAVAARNDSNADRGRSADWWSTPDLWLETLEAAGIARTVLYPTAALSHGRIRDVDWSIALAHAYNDWLGSQYYSRDPRLGWVALLPLQDPVESAKELKRCVSEGGAAGGVLAAAGLNRALGAPEFFSLYAEAESLGVPLIVHGAPGVVLPDQFDRFSHVHVLAHPMLQLISMTSMFQSGVFDRFPKLRIGYFEAGASWVPFLVSRLDRTASLIGREPYDVYATSGSQSAGDVIREGRVFFSVEGDEPHVDAVLGDFGAQCLCFASDFPHEQGSAAAIKHEMAEIGNHPDLTDQQKQAILVGNAELLYRFDSAPSSVAKSAAVPAAELASGSA